MGRAKICNVNGLSVEGPWNWRVNRLVFSALYMGKAELRRKARTGYHGYRLMGPWYFTFSFLCEPLVDRSFQFSPLLPGWGGGTPVYNLYGYVLRDRVWFSSCSFLNPIHSRTMGSFNRKRLAGLLVYAMQAKTLSHVQ